MPHTDSHLDAMLRHLGAAYYDSLHGRATGSDVTRALETVEAQLDEGGSGHPGAAARSFDGFQAVDEPDGARHGRGWSRRVSDVMTTTVITVDRITPYKEIARLLAEHRISGMPVLKLGREVAGVVTEADLLQEQGTASRRLRSAARRRWSRGSRQAALTAGELMTSPAVTVSAGATIPSAARLMSTHHFRILPVVDEKARLVGVVSRRELLSVFLRADEEIAADVRRVLEDILLAEPGEADVSVHDGVVTLTGTLDPKAGPHGDLIPLARRLMWDVDGVVDIVDRLGPQAAQALPEDAVPRPANPPEH
jgi:CBS domain-containing protein